jgi:ElaA protein
MHTASFDELDTTTLYALLRLRVDVFVVEQQSAYPELDGRDAEPSTLHIWLAREGEPVAYLRLLSEPDGTARIGRVVVARQARGAGLAGRLMAEALARIGERECVLDAQTPLVGFYTGLGFTPTGPEFMEDGVAHVPMRRGVHSRRPM